MENEKEKKIVEALESENENDLGVWQFHDKGRGVIALRQFEPGEFVVEYSGELINSEEIKLREATYSAATLSSSYMYYFVYKNKRMCIDATVETGRCGRLINHSRSKANVKPQLLDVKNIPRLAFFAIRKIEKFEELLYDYGDRRVKILAANPWLAH